MLTARQSELLTYIEERSRAGGVGPSYQEMKERLGLGSKSGIHRLILALEERGFIRRLPGKSRAIEVLDRSRETIDDPRMVAMAMARDHLSLDDLRSLVREMSATAGPADLDHLVP